MSNETLNQTINGKTTPSGARILERLSVLDRRRLARTTKFQFDILVTTSLHCVNRDEDGAPKTAVYGDVQRGRISSQAIRRAARFSAHFGATRRARRTRDAGVFAYQELRSLGVSEEVAIEAALTINFALGAGGTKPDATAVAQEKKGGKGTKGRKGGEEKPEAVQPPQSPLQEAIAKVLTFNEQNTPVVRMAKSGESEAKAREFCIANNLRDIPALVVSTKEFEAIDDFLDKVAAVAAETPERVPETVRAWCQEAQAKRLLTHWVDLDLALFGRMVAAVPEFNVDAAVAVGHGLTTHEFEIQTDYWSAGEELNALNGTGAAITDYQYNGAGIYHIPAVYDAEAVLENLESTYADPNERKAAALKAAEAFFDSMLAPLPIGKRNGHASDVVAVYAIVDARTTATHNDALAFHRPVTLQEGPDMVVSSIERLRRFHESFRKSHGTDGDFRIYNGWPDAQRVNPSEKEFRTIGDLKAWFLDLVASRPFDRVGRAAEAASERT